MAADFDIAIIGGGINGAGIARDAAGRGLSVALFEQGDLAQATSSASTKLIHGGLRYLEHYEFRLVREALVEREVLWQIAPHIIRPLRFVLPHHAGLRPAWLLRLGLFLYDNLGGRKRLPATRMLDLAHDPAGAPLKAGFAKGFEYSDCRVDDARLVVLNARDAAERGARIRTRTRVTAAKRAAGLWQIDAEGVGGGAATRLTARILVNAGGPWVADILNTVVKREAPAKIRMVQGSHIVVPRLFDHDRAYIFQNGDGRIVFAIPYERDFTLIGTTDTDYRGDPGKVFAGEAEVAYLVSAINEYFRVPIRAEDVVRTYSGVRPLYDDGASRAQEATRDYVLELDAPEKRAPLLSVFGGKITTYRRLAEAALEMLGPHIGEEAKAKEGWTGRTPLPGGDFSVERLPQMIGDLVARHPFLSEEDATRLLRAYGTRAARVLGQATTAADLGRDFGAGLTEAELQHLVREEWAMTGGDVLWRRSKLGLRLDSAARAAVDDAVRLIASGGALKAASNG